LFPVAARHKPVCDHRFQPLQVLELRFAPLLADSLTLINFVLHLRTLRMNLWVRYADISAVSLRTVAFLELVLGESIEP